MCSTLCSWNLLRIKLQIGTLEPYSKLKFTSTCILHIACIVYISSSLSVVIYMFFHHLYKQPTHKIHHVYCTVHLLSMQCHVSQINMYNIQAIIHDFNTYMIFNATDVMPLYIHHCINMRYCISCTASRITHTHMFITHHVLAPKKHFAAYTIRVRMYVCTYVRTYVGTYVCTYVRMYVRTYCTYCM